MRTNGDGLAMDNLFTWIFRNVTSLDPKDAILRLRPGLDQKMRHCPIPARTARTRRPEHTFSIFIAGQE